MAAAPVPPVPTALPPSQPKPAPPPPMAGPIDLGSSFLRIPGGAKYPQLVRASWRYRVAFSASSELPPLGWPVEQVRRLGRPEPQDRGARREFRQESQELPRQGVLSRFSMVTSLMLLDRNLRIEPAEALEEKPWPAAAEHGRPTATVVARHRGIRGFPIPLVGPRDPGMAGYVAVRPEWFVTGAAARPLWTGVEALAAEVRPLLPETATVLPCELGETERVERLHEPELQGGPIDACHVETQALAVELTARKPVPRLTVGDAPWSPKYYEGPEDHREEIANRLREAVGGGELQFAIRYDEVNQEIGGATIVSVFGQKQGASPYWVPAQTFPVHGGVLKDLRERRHGTGIHVPQLLMRPLRPRVVMTDTGTPDDHELRQARESGVISISTLRSAGGFRR